MPCVNKSTHAIRLSYLKIISLSVFNHFDYMMNDDHYFHNIPSSADVPREDFEHLIEGISQQRDIVGSIPTLLTSRIQPYEDISVITFGNFLSFCI